MRYTLNQCKMNIFCYLQLSPKAVTVMTKGTKLSTYVLFSLYIDNKTWTIFAKTEILQEKTLP